jgi:hypothetical protein
LISQISGWLALAIGHQRGWPRFEIRIKVIYPNKRSLDIAGINYSFALLDMELIAGVANGVSPITGYGEGIVTLSAKVQWLQLLRLMANLGTTCSEPLAYQFTAKIDFNGLLPTQRLEESGEITINKSVPRDLFLCLNRIKLCYYPVPFRWHGFVFASAGINRVIYF